MFVNSGTRGNKRGLLCQLSAVLSFIKPGTRQTGLTGRPQKSFGMNRWHSSRKGEKIATKKEREKDSRVNDWWRRECILWQRVLRKCMGVKRQKKRRIKEMFSKWMPTTFVKEDYFGTPLCTTCKSNEGGDKDPNLRNRGRGWSGGGGEGQIQGLKG